MKATREQMIAAVKEHAEANYSSGGWDEVVEAWGDDDIAEAMGSARTTNGAICKVAAIVKVRHEYAEDIRATAF